MVRTILLSVLGLLALAGFALGVMLMVDAEQRPTAGGAIHEIEALILILIGTTALAGIAAGIKR